MITTVLSFLFFLIPSIIGFSVSRRQWLIFGVNLLMVIVTTAVVEVTTDPKTAHVLSVWTSIAIGVFAIAWWVGLIIWALRSRRRTNPKSKRCGWNFKSSGMARRLPSRLPALHLMTLSNTHWKDLGDLQIVSEPRPTTRLATGSDSIPLRLTKAAHARWSTKLNLASVNSCGNPVERPPSKPRGRIRPTILALTFLDPISMAQLNCAPGES